jgi:xanthine/CO dehydrogenase XdhC/CoxF family maturation factor
MFAKIMTHNFTQDRELLRVLLPRPLRYLGVLGPKSRMERLLQALADDGCTFADHHVARLRGPAGLDLGAETPEEIAVSIIGEMQAVLAGRDGGALRDRTGPIHDPAERSPVSP